MTWNEPTPKWRKAHKEHRCQGDGCGKVIARGDRYLDRAIPDSDYTHFRYCEACGEPMMVMEESYRLISRHGDFPDRYQERISSTGWKNLRAELIELRGNRCERCKEEKASLDLHHVHYRSLGDEQPEDVELLCRECHIEADEARRPKKRTEPQEGWILGEDGEYHWRKFDRDTIYVAGSDGRYVPIVMKPKGES